MRSAFQMAGLVLFNLENPDEDMIVYDESDYVRFEGGFCGQYFAFAANKSDESTFGLVDIDEAACLNEYTSRDNFLLSADRRGIYLSDSNLLVRFEPDTLKETELAYTDNGEYFRFFCWN